MYPQRMVSQALGLALLVTLVVLAPSACGGAGQEQADKPRPLPEVEKALRAGGEYRTEEFKPSFSFRVGENWAMETDPPEGPEGPDELELTWRKGTMNLLFLNIKEVIEPTRSGTSTVEQAPKDMVAWFQHHPYRNISMPKPVGPNFDRPKSVTVKQAPKDMVAWFQHHPYLKTDKPNPVTVGGVKGVQLHMVVEVPNDYYGVCDTGGCLDIATLGEFTALVFEEGTKERVIVLEDVKGEPLTINFGAPEAKFDEFAPEGKKLVDSIKWTRGS